MIILPLKALPERTFEIEIGNIPYEIKLFWNRRAGKLTMNITEDGEYSINGISVVSGINFIERFSFSTIKYMYAINAADFSQDLVFDELGQTSFIAILDETEVIAIETIQESPS